MFQLFIIIITLILFKITTAINKTYAGESRREEKQERKEGRKQRENKESHHGDENDNVKKKHNNQSNEVLKNVLLRQYIDLDELKKIKLYSS